ncbi:MmcQ/YjbR family DNA-binding protein [uncultured Jatrophihabitans sp.]|uniref:MmcQ/YjbR family DNA-binding protein n=1 Tax=uncultured Jatrophihabitans sp. TaxID=1610747 RepID=UPI0035CA683F
MATWDDVRRIASELPETVEQAGRTTKWQVRNKLFAWERPLRPSDLAALVELGTAAPEGDILGVRVADEGVKHALIAANPDAIFTIPHFNGYAAVLVLLDRIEFPELEELITDSWLLRAPKKLATQFLAG